MEHSRRQLLAGVAAASTALAGCSFFDEAADIEGSVADSEFDAVEVQRVDQSFTGTAQGRALTVLTELRNTGGETIPPETLCLRVRFFDADDQRLGEGGVPLRRELPPETTLQLSYVSHDRPDAVARYEVRLVGC